MHATIALEVKLSGVPMATAKQELERLLAQQPDDSSYEELVRAMAFEIMVKRGLEDSDAGRTVSDKEIRRRIESWRK
jgi:predicted transcriptional regulator